MSDSPFAKLEARIGHVFTDVALCEQALTHTSWSNESADVTRDSNERMEFLGDAVLALVVSDLLMKEFPDSAEGDLSKVRAVVVSETGLASIAADLDLGPWIFLGKGEDQAGGRKRPSNLANALEALIGAVFLDGGFAAASRVVERMVAGPVAEAPGKIALRDFKSRLQELSQAHLKLEPRYSDVGTSGLDHEKTFEVAVWIGDREYGRAAGRSKKQAQQAAAERALDLLEGAIAAGSDLSLPRRQ